MSDNETPTDSSDQVACHVCGKTFDSQEDLQEHLAREHPDEVMPGIWEDSR
jgi:hypothetical protein